MKSVKLNYRACGPHFGGKMKELEAAVEKFTEEDVLKLETEKELSFYRSGEPVTLKLGDVVIFERQ